LKKFDESEKLFLEADRVDLAIKMRMTLGDWPRVIELLRDDHNITSTTILEIFDKLGDHFYEKQQWYDNMS